MLRKVFYLLFFSLYSINVLAGPQSGLYMGEFSDGFFDDFIMLYVKSDNTLTMFGVNTEFGVGAKIENININSVSGAFSYTEDGQVFSGTINKSLASGSVSSSSPPATSFYTASKKLFSGPNISQAGYYKGTFSGCGGIQFSGPMDAVISPSGVLHIYDEITASNFPELIEVVDGGKFQLLGSGGTFNGVTVATNFLSGTASGNTIGGILDFGYTCSGSFYLTKVDALQNYDFDSDGLNNEIDNCPNAPNTNQLNSDGDTEGNVCDLDDDNDELPDDWEIANGTNPLIDDASGDINGNSYTNLQEYRVEINPALDTDNDGIKDAWEIANGTNLLVDDAASDIDGDGYTNLQEYLAENDPKLDTDNDGMFDAWEIENGFKPDDGSDCPSWVCKPALNTGWRSIIYN